MGGLGCGQESIFNSSRSDVEGRPGLRPWEGKEQLQEGFTQLINASDRSTESMKLSTQKNELWTVAVVERS